MSAVITTALRCRYSAPNDWSVDTILDCIPVNKTRIVIFKLGRSSGLGREYQFRAAAFEDTTMLWDKPLSLAQALAEREDHDHRTPRRLRPHP